MNNSRLLKEWKQLIKSGNKYNITPITDEDLTHWQCILQGPNKSLYQGFNFTLKILIPIDYPMSPPQVKFIPNTMPHPNVDWNTGVLCLDVLKNMWSPIFNLQYIVECVIRLLNEPNGDSPLNLELGTLLRLGDHSGYNGLIKYYLHHHQSHHGDANIII
ncbi:ubiquitin-conjugating enzyme E2-21 kDa [Monosporozyma unispora]|nr:E2 ubiquitin-protein ligase peroxin 4 [Kazachstania unispora]